MMILNRFRFLRIEALVILTGICMTVSEHNVMGQIDHPVESGAVEFELGEVIYENPLSSPEDIEGWVVESSLENHPAITFPHGRMRMESDVHFLLWCPEDFPDNIAVSWEFRPRADQGLAMFWIAATGEEGKDLFDPSLAKRDGTYSAYRRGDINALHVAYFRRNHAPPGRAMGEINFQICSLRKTTTEDDGPVVQRAPDPLPGARDAIQPYQMQVIKHGRHYRFSINDFTIIDWVDGSKSPLAGGKIGFRQMQGLIGDYANLKVQRVHKAVSNE